MDNDNVLGNRIKESRQESEMTQNEMADKLNVASNTVSDWETVKIIPPSDRLKDIALLLNKSIDYLIGIVNKENRNTKEQRDYDILSLLYGFDRHFPDLKEQLQTDFRVTNEDPYEIMAIIDLSLIEHYDKYIQYKEAANKDEDYSFFLPYITHAYKESVCVRGLRKPSKESINDRIMKYKQAIADSPVLE